MFVINPTERSKAKAELQKIRAAVNQEVLDIFRGFVVVAYDSVVDKTPQWTGHAAAQWNIGINHVDMSTSSLYAIQNLTVSEGVRDRNRVNGLPQAKSKGDPAAIAEAKRRQTGNVEQIKLDDIIFISNNVESLLNEAYADKLERNPNSYLREVNEPGHMVARTVEWFNSRVAILDPSMRARFKMAKLSDSGIMETM